MSIIPLMIVMALILGAGFVIAFILSVNSDQFEDLETPAHRILHDEPSERIKHE